MRVQGLPRAASARLSFKRRTAQRGTLTLTIPQAVATGVYHLRLSVRSGRHAPTVPLQLTVAAPKLVSFQVSATVGNLDPGAPISLNLTVRNPNSVPISISQLSATVKDVSAPNATAGLPCGLADFDVRQFQGQYPLVVAANTTRTLSDFGIAPALQPQLTLLDRPVNQDGCQGAKATLAFGGTATGQ